MQDSLKSLGGINHPRQSGLLGYHLTHKARKNKDLSHSGLTLLLISTTGRTILNIDSEMVTLQDKDTGTIIDGYYRKDVIIRDRRPVFEIYNEQTNENNTAILTLNIDGQRTLLSIFDKESLEMARMALNMLEKKLSAPTLEIKFPNNIFIFILALYS